MSTRLSPSPSIHRPRTHTPHKLIERITNSHTGQMLEVDDNRDAHDRGRLLPSSSPAHPPPAASSRTTHSTTAPRALVSTLLFLGGAAIVLLCGLLGLMPPEAAGASSGVRGGGWEQQRMAAAAEPASSRSDDGIAGLVRRGSGRQQQYGPLSISWWGQERSRGGWVLWVVVAVDRLCGGEVVGDCLESVD